SMPTSYLLLRPPPVSTLFPYTTLFRSRHLQEGRGERVAFECEGDELTYQQFGERVNRAGNALRNLGVRVEERVLLLLLDTPDFRSEEHTSELQSLAYLVCRLLLEKKKK